MESCKITILVDNQPSKQKPALQSEHGLSMFIEVGEWRLLCDMGASTLFAENAELLSIDLSQLNAAFISHGHADHTGGLDCFLSKFPNIPIWLSSHIAKQQFYSSRRGPCRDISTDIQLFNQHAHAFHWVDNSCWLTPSVALIKCQENTYYRPRGNTFLTTTINGVNHPDDFRHELSLAIRTSHGLVVVSSCSHVGALNILQACTNFTREYRVRAFVGGLHLVDSHYVKQEVEYFTSCFERKYSDTLLYTGHCTGDIAKEELCKLLPQTQIIHTGMSIAFTD